VSVMLNSCLRLRECVVQLYLANCVPKHQDPFRATSPTESPDGVWTFRARPACAARTSARDSRAR
jgi:hypothetical protein